MKLKIIEGKIIELPKGSKEGFYIDGLLKINLDLIKKIIKKNWDYIYAIDGEVGAGKSVFAQLIGHYVTNGNLKIENICFTGADFKKRILSANKYECIIFDEAFRGLSSRSALTQTNKQIIEMLNEIRQKNLFVLIILPSVWDLDSYARLFRCKGLLHVYTDKSRARGYFKYYRNDSQNSFYKSFFHKSPNKYRYPKHSQMKGRFTEQYFVGEKAYKDKKAGVLGSDHVAQENRERQERKNKKIAKEIYFRLQAANLNLNRKKQAEIIGFHRDTLRKWDNDASYGRTGKNNLKIDPKTEQPKENFSNEL